MDEPTLSAYDAKAAAYSDDWVAQPVPADIHALWRRYFATGAPSADIGCGSGRDVDWLNRNGYPCVGFDASPGLLTEARRRFPHWRFEQALLPELGELPDASYANVVCETVIMHLPAPEIGPAVRALARLLAPGGTLYLSWRVAAGGDTRDAAGRLYSAFAAADVRSALSALSLLHDVETDSVSSGRRVHRLVARRGPG